MATNLPAFPVVHVTIRPDGSAHVNVAGKHADFAAGDPAATRAAVLAYAVEVAQGLGRGVRMHAVEPGATYKLAVHPGGEVEDLEPIGRKGRPSGQTKPPRPIPAAPTIPTGLGVGAPPVVPPAPAPPPPRPLVPSVPEPSAPPTAAVDEVTTTRAELGLTATAAKRTATVTFSTGDVALIGQPAIVGRKPVRAAADWAGTQLVTVHDDTRQVSSVHCIIEWVDGRLLVTDRDSTNGMTITRPPAAAHELDPGKPYELHDGDVLQLGRDVLATVALTPMHQETAR